MLREIIRNFVVKTNYQPFIWFYKAYYGLILKIIAYVLKKQKEVAAIYLTAGMAMGDVVYGLSDIDLIIIVEDGKENKQKIERIYGKLSFFIPLLSYQERGIFNISEVSSAYEYSFFYLKYKFFNECKKAGKLLYGRDILSDFTDLDSRANKESIFGQLAFIWAIMVKNFFLKDMNDTLTRDYLCYKVSAESCKAFILANVNGQISTREKALESIQGYLDEDCLTYIGKLQKLSKNRFYSKDAGLLQETYNFCFHLLGKTIRYIDDSWYEYDEEVTLGERINFCFESLDFVVSGINRQKIDAIMDLIHREYGEYIQSVLLSPFDIAHIDEKIICLFIVQKKDIPIEIIKRLNSLARSDRHRQLLHLYIVMPDMAISLDRDDFVQPYRVLFTTNIMPLTFLYLSTPASVISGNPLNNKKSKKDLIKYYLYKFSESISLDKATILRLINDANIVRLPNLDFQLFFWQAIRLKLIEASLLLEKIFIPLSSAQVCRECDNSRSFNFHWLKKFHDEYKKDLNGIPSDSEAYFPEAITALKKIYGLYSEESNAKYEYAKE